MTHPTKAICGTLLKDFIKLSGGKDGEPLYKTADLTHALEQTEVLDFHQTVEINGIKVTILFLSLHDGHLLIFLDHIFCVCMMVFPWPIYPAIGEDAMLAPEIFS